ncbi:FAD-dependent oxidoreductase [Streptomyces sp. N2-109]|uniref:FAD-dependent oxidoreductase n=1 Tax=Streptomyces gossypii TaxID=2883101 RepID=A0ABT2JSU7_9ACTN|nr:FAD-dependent oxidoreductase [Streptomyces gossypii]MCT2590334.1 FAD-dependent oxidoreductase [Streptomyces gossypii]
MSGTQRVVVIGGGMAAARLESRLGGGVELTVIGEEQHPAYNRVLLAEVLSGRYAPEVIALPERPGTRRLRGVRAVRVDRAERVVRCADGSVVGYDTLVLATGSRPVLPPLRGLWTGPTVCGTAGGAADGAADGGAADDDELPGGVHPFRTLDDCLALGRAAREGLRAVVIGGGLLGVSAARALARRGAHVVLTQQGEHLMERQLDPEAARLLRRHLEELGVEVHTECRVRGLLTRRPERAAPRAVKAVTLADGYRLDCELVVLACGVRPATGLARVAGLRVGRGVVVDDQLRTSDPRIFAIGDCAEHDGTVYGLAGAAQDQADTVAAVLNAGAGHRAGCETPPRYSGTRALTRLTLAAQPAAPLPPSAPATAAPAVPAPAQLPLDLASFGETEAQPDDDVVRLTDATRSVYRKVIVRGDRLVGGILLGDLGSVGAVAQTWEGDEPLSSAPLIHLLTNDGGHFDVHT